MNENRKSLTDLLRSFSNLRQDESVDQPTAPEIAATNVCNLNEKSDLQPQIGASEADVKLVLQARYEKLRQFDTYTVEIGPETFNPVLMNEIGLLTTAIALEDKALVVKIDPGTRDSLRNNPYYLAQFEGMLVLLRNLTPLLKGRLQIIENDEQTVQEAASIAKNGSDFNLAETLDQSRAIKRPELTVLTGSGSAKTSSLRESLKSERASIVDELSRSESPVTNLVDGRQAEAWDEAYAVEGNADLQGRLFKSISLTELDAKLKCSKLVLSIHDEAATFFGTSEIGPALTHAILTGQSLRVMLEPLDRTNFMFVQLSDKLKQITAALEAGTVTEAEFTEKVKVAFRLPADFDMAQLSENDLNREVLRAFMENDKLDWDTIAASDFGQSGFFMEAENIFLQRETTRIQVSAFLETLNARGIKADVTLDSSPEELLETLKADNQREGAGQVEKPKNDFDRLLKIIDKPKNENGGLIMGTPEEIMEALSTLLVNRGLEQKGYQLKLEPTANDDRRTSFREILADQKLYRVYLETDIDPLTKKRNKVYISELVGTDLGNGEVRLLANVAVIKAAFETEYGIYQVEADRTREELLRLQNDFQRQLNTNKTLEEMAFDLQRQNNNLSRELRVALEQQARAQRVSSDANRGRTSAVSSYG